MAKAPVRPRLMVFLAAFCSGGWLGCGHTTQISTAPEGARVFINGREICERTPCVYDGKLGMSRRYHLQIQKPGYQDVDLYLDKELNLKWWAGVTLVTSYASPLVSSFFHNLEDSLAFTLDPVPGFVPPAPPPPPPGYPQPPAQPWPPPASPSAPPYPPPAWSPPASPAYPAPAPPPSDPPPMPAPPPSGPPPAPTQAPSPSPASPVPSPPAQAPPESPPTTVPSAPADLAPAPPQQP